MTDKFNVIRAIFLIFTIVNNVHGYEACKGAFDSGCNQQKVDTIKSQLQKSFQGNTDIIFMELIRKKALDEYDNYVKEIKSTVTCFEVVKYAEQCIKSKSEVSKCRDSVRRYDECSSKLGIIYSNVYSQNLDMRISLSLWNPKGKPHEFNNRPKDKYRVAPEHLSYVTDFEIEKLSEGEKKLANDIFEIEKDNTFKEYLIEEIKVKNKREDRNELWKQERDYEKKRKKLSAKRNRKRYLLLRKGVDPERIKEMLYDPFLDNPPEFIKQKRAEIIIKEKDLASFKKPKSFVDILRYNDAIKEHKMNMMDKYKYIYLETVLSNPVLKHISSAEPSEDDIHQAFVSLSSDLADKRKKIENLNIKDLNQFLFFDIMVEDVLEENPFFCLNAINKKEKIQSSREIKENIFAFGGLVLCPFTGFGCAGAMFGGSVVNFLDTKERLDTTMEYGSLPGMATASEISNQAQKQGMSASMVLLSTPVSLIGKVGLKAVGTDVIANNMKNYYKAIKKNGLKRAIIKPKESNDIYIAAFKKMKEKPDVHDYLDFIVQAPVIGVTKLITKKSYTFQPGEFAVKKLEKKLLKASEEFAGPVMYLGNLVDFRLFLTGYGAAYTYGRKLSNEKPERQEYAKARFGNYDSDPRFSKVKEIEKACKLAESCKSDVDLIVQYNNNLVLDGVMAFDKFSDDFFEKNTDDDKKPNMNEYISRLLLDQKVQEYGSQIFPNFYSYYPTGFNKNLVGEQRKAQRGILLFDVLRLKIAQDIHDNSIERFLEQKEISKEFALFIKTSPDAQEIIKSSADTKERKKLLGKALNSWVELNQSHLFNHP